MIESGMVDLRCLKCNNVTESHTGVDYKICPSCGEKIVPSEKTVVQNTRRGNN